LVLSPLRLYLFPQGVEFLPGREVVGVPFCPLHQYFPPGLLEPSALLVASEAFGLNGFLLQAELLPGFRKFLFAFTQRRLLPLLVTLLLIQAYLELPKEFPLLLQRGLPAVQFGTHTSKHLRMKRLPRSVGRRERIGRTVEDFVRGFVPLVGCDVRRRLVCLL